jgi:hypothetical protein
VYRILYRFSNYKKSKRIVSFISSGAGIVCAGFLLFTLNQLKKQDKTPSVLYASKFTPGISIDFRENNTYKCGKHAFMSSDYIRGHYTLKDSLIYLDRSNIFGLVVSNRLLLKTIPITDATRNKKRNNLLTLLFSTSSADTTPKTFLYQVDQNGKVINSAIVLKVIPNHY